MGFVAPASGHWQAKACPTIFSISLLVVAVGERRLLIGRKARPALKSGAAFLEAGLGPCPPFWAGGQCDPVSAGAVWPPPPGPSRPLLFGRGGAVANWAPATPGTKVAA